MYLHELTKKSNRPWWAAAALLLVLAACTRDVTVEVKPADPDAPTPYQLNIPPGFTEPVIPSYNPMTVEGIQLGRMLFYDTIVSTNGLRCASCHQQARAFSSPLFVNQQGQPISVPPHINLAWNPEFFWDGTAPILDHVAVGDFTPAFFDPDMDLLVQKFKNHPVYPGLFRKAYGIKDVGAVSHDSLIMTISYAVSQFMRTLISANSRFDRFVNHEINLTNEEFDGFLTYYTERGDCFHCHGTLLLTNNTFNNNGLDTVFVGLDQGYYLHTGNPSDLGKFSPPTLRNVALTAPYMHDGRFQTLEEVVEFYNSGVHLNSPNIDPLMTKPAKLNGLQLTEQQKANLVTFLRALTDSSFVTNPDFGSPF